MIEKDDVKTLRDALAAGPTPGPWVASFGKDFIAFYGASSEAEQREQHGGLTCSECGHEPHECGPHVLSAELRSQDTGDSVAPSREDVAFIEAASPDRIGRLLDRLDGLEDALQTLLAIHTEPAGLDGKFGKALDKALQEQQTKVDAAVFKAKSAVAKSGCDMALAHQVNEESEQQPLTDEQIEERWEWVTGRTKKHLVFARSIERAHGIVG